MVARFTPTTRFTPSFPHRFIVAENRTNRAPEWRLVLMGAFICTAQTAAPRHLFFLSHFAPSAWGQSELEVEKCLSRSKR